METGAALTGPLDKISRPETTVWPAEILQILALTRSTVLAGTMIRIAVTILVAVVQATCSSSQKCRSFGAVRGTRSCPLGHRLSSTPFWQPCPSGNGKTKDTSFLGIITLNACLKDSFFMVQVQVVKVGLPATNKPMQVQEGPVICKDITANCDKKPSAAEPGKYTSNDWSNCPTCFLAAQRRTTQHGFF